jgi:hypothetical protein
MLECAEKPRCARRTAEGGCPHIRRPHWLSPHFPICQLSLVEMSAVFAVEEVAHGFAAGSVGAFVGLQRVGGFLARRFFFAAIRAAVGEARFAGLEFEFFSADYAGFDGMRHLFMIQGHGIGDATTGWERNSVKEILTVEGVALGGAEAGIADDAAQFLFRGAIRYAGGADYIFF